MAAPPDDEQGSGRFTIQHIETHQLARVQFQPGFNQENWSAFDPAFRKMQDDGCVNWDIDLRQVASINSMFMGLLVGFNTIVQAKGGNARFLVDKKTQTAQILNLSRLNRVLNIQEM